MYLQGITIVAKKKQKRKANKSIQNQKPSVSQLKALERLIEKQDFDQAASRFEVLIKQFPKFSVLYYLGLDLYKDAGETAKATWVALRWTQASPNSVQGWKALASFSLENGYLALLHKAITRHNQLAADSGDELINDPSLQELQGMIMEDSVGNPVPDSLADAVEFDRGKLFLDARLWGKAIAFMEPKRDYPSIANNYALALFHAGKIKEAKQAYLEAYETEPDNLFAMSGYIRLLVWEGELEKANQFASKMKEEKPERPFYADAQLMTLSFLGRFNEAFSCYQRFDEEQLGKMEQPFYDLIAAIAFIIGEKKLAKGLWQNNADKEQNRGGEKDPVSLLNTTPERNRTPALFDNSELLPLSWIDTLRVTIEQNKKDPDIFATMRREIVALPSIDYLRLARESINDLGGYFIEILLMSYAFNGGDKEKNLLIEQFKSHRTDLKSKMDLLTRLQNQGILSSKDTIKCWNGSVVTEIKSLDFNITREAKESSYSEKDYSLLAEALDLLRANETKKARAILLKLVKRYPEDPILRGNLAASWTFDDPDKSSAEYESILNDFPDYIFARCKVAEEKIMNGQLEEAKQLLDGLLDRGEYHIDEFIIINGINAYYQAVVGKEDAAQRAQSYLDMADKAVKFDHEKQALANWSEKVDVILNNSLLGRGSKNGKNLLNALRKLIKSSK